MEKYVKYLFKVTIEKKWHAQIFDFLSLKSSPPGQFLASFNSRRYLIEFWNFWLQLKKQRSASKTVYDFSIALKATITFKVKESMLLVEHKYKL